MTARLMSLADVCEINPRLPRSHGLTDETEVSFVPMAAVDEVAGDIRDKQSRTFGEVKKGYTHFREGDVLFAKITPCMENGKAAVARDLIGGLGFGSTEFHVLRSKESVLPEWLYYFVRRESFRKKAKRNFTGTAGQQRVPTTFLSTTEIPVPSLFEQRRIVDLLSRTEGIVRLRREAQKKAAELIPAIFLEMFGDPATNPKGWPSKRLGDYLNIQTSVRVPDIEREGDVPCIGADSIESGTGQIVSWPTVTDVHPISGKYGFCQGDVLYSKIRPVLRKVVIAPSDGYCSADMYPLRVGEVATCEYVHALLLSKAFTDYAVGVSMRAQMPKVNRETLFAYSHPLPPIALQRIFSERAKEIFALQEGQRHALRVAKAAFEALLSRAFLN